MLFADHMAASFLRGTLLVVEFLVFGVYGDPGSLLAILMALSIEVMGKELSTFYIHCRLAALYI